jgi:AraC-like DNA-binding protein
MDALSDILTSIRLKSSVYFRRDFSAPWGMKFDQSTYALFHIVVRGKCLLKFDTDKPAFELSVGDIVVFPKGNAHWIADDQKSIRVNSKDVVNAILRNRPIFSGDGNPTTLICGHFEFDGELDHPLISNLPKLIYIPDKDRRELTWLERVANLINYETDSGKAGSEVVITKLAEVLFIHILRTYMLQKNKTNDFFAALKDKQINNALDLIHGEPKNNWKLFDIAKQVGMSRSAFAQRFKNIVGLTPMQYITKWRMIKAKELLTYRQLSIIEIAEQVGYLSEAAFIRAFKRHHKINPGSMRKKIIKSNLH